LTTSSRVDGGAQPIASGSPNRITELIQKYILDRKRPDAVEAVFGLPIEREGDDYVALARKVEADRARIVRFRKYRSSSSRPAAP
jgi:hypothetical protein